MIETFDRGNHILVIDRTGREPVAYRVPKGASPSILKKAANFARASVKHVKSGRRKATQEQIDERFAICTKCDYLDPKTMECSKCGCGIRKVAGAISKLTWASTSCPEGFWSAV